MPVDYNFSPRVAEVQDPSVIITMQDLVDTSRIDEEEFSKGLSFKNIMNASGKQDLGGGVSVGITVSMQNMLLAFEARTTPAETGTVTTPSGAPVIGRITFSDGAADFVAAGVQRGSMVINFTDQSIADVVSVDNLTTLTTKVLVNGIGNTYDTADVYHVYNVIQCTARGGNLTAVGSTGAGISPILPTAFTQVVIEQSASATLIQDTDTAADIEFVTKFLRNRTHTDPATGIMTIFDDNDTDVFMTAQIFDTVSGSTADLYDTASDRLDRRNRFTT